VINRAPGLKLVVQTLLSSLRPIGNIVLICCTFFIIFGILGVQVWMMTVFDMIVILIRVDMMSPEGVKQSADRNSETERHGCQYCQSTENITGSNDT
jgi:hypothetical protein